MIAITTVLLVLIAVLLFGLIIFIHEFGHFFTAKLCGIKVNEFAIGMGPTILKKQGKETQYSLRLFPIGGFCAMEGEDEDSDDNRAFGNKPVWKRVIVVAAGAIMNILLGFILMMIILGQNEAFLSTTISRFTENAATEQAGLQVGDQFYSVDGYQITTDKDLSFALATANPSSVDIEVKRGDEILRFEDVQFHTVTDDAGNEILQIDFLVLPIENNFGNLIVKSGENTVSTVRMVWNSLIGLITGRYGFQDVAGPVGAAGAITQAASNGLEVSFGAAINNILMMMVIITVNLGIVNLLPLPALDGGRLIFLIIEGIRRKPVNPKYEGWVHTAGFLILMAFMVVVTFSDILRLVTGTGLGG